jgi:hypothetical protein
MATRETVVRVVELGQRWRLDLPGRDSRSFVVDAILGDKVTLIRSDGVVESTSRPAMIGDHRWILVLENGEEVSASVSDEAVRRKAPFPHETVKAAVVDILALAWAYDHSRGEIEDPHADRLLADLINKTQEYRGRYEQRAREGQLSNELIERVANVYRHMRGKTRAMLKVEFADVFAEYGISVDESDTERLASVEQAIVSERVDGGTGGPLETARTQLSKVFKMTTTRSQTVKARADKQGDVGIPKILAAFAYNCGPGIAGISRYAREILEKW